jgi:SAM-dependent methyltransferase
MLFENLEQYKEIEHEIHPKDEMYSFLTTHPNPATRDAPLKAYFESGASMKRDLLEILEMIEFDLNSTTRFLEFACGYGRFTRHWVKVVEPEKITVSDVYKDAVDFQMKVFGVKGIYSAFNPLDVKFPEKYDVIFVASLFSHLPAHTFRLWLKQLYLALNENGVLIFSTHGKSCMANPTEMPASGSSFRRQSESETHSYDEYGAMFVTSEFVHKAVKEEMGQMVLLEAPKCLWSYQDVYVVMRTANENLETMFLNKGDEKILFSVDVYKDGFLMGWILDKTNPLNRLQIELLCKDRIVGKGVADQFRQDLADAKIGDGYCSFRIKVDPTAKSLGKQIRIRVENYKTEFCVYRSSITDWVVP